MKGLTLPFYIRGKKINSLSFFPHAYAKGGVKPFIPSYVANFNGLDVFLPFTLPSLFAKPFTLIRLFVRISPIPGG